MPSQSIQSAAASVMSVLSHPSWDVVTVFALIAIGFFYGISRGKQRMFSAVLYTYVAVALLDVLPVRRIGELIGMTDLFLLQTGLFVITLFLLLTLLGRGKSRAAARLASWWQVILLSFVQAGLLIHVIFNFLPENQIGQLAPVTRTVFANPSLHVWWFIAPLAVLVFLRRFGAREE